MNKQIAATHMQNVNWEKIENNNNNRNNGGDKSLLN